MTPSISVLVPCYNEAGFIGPCLESVLEPFVLANTEVLVIDGMSQDWTRDVVEQLAERCSVVRLLDNPGRLQSHGMNVGLAAARGSIIVRLDAHSTYPPGYVETCVRLLERTDAANVGGVMEPRGTGPFTNAVARAMMHPLGIGGSKFHHGTFSGYVDTCYLGTYHKDVFDRVGGYDPDSHPAEDAELNCRIIEQGGRIYLDSSIRVQYQPRASPRLLARQFFWYGRGRCALILKHKRLFSMGRLAPPTLVSAIVGALIGAIWSPLWLMIPGAYLSGAVVAGLYLARRERDRLRLGLLQAAVLATMHLSYGSGFLLKLIGVLR